MHLKLRDDIRTALKAKEKETVTTLRSILALAQDIGLKDNRKEITEEDVVTASIKLVKEATEGMDIYRMVDTPIANENFERNYLLKTIASRYLPKQYSEDELTDVISVIIGTIEYSTGSRASMKNMGEVMKTVKNQLPVGSYDGKILSALVKKSLS